MKIQEIVNIEIPALKEGEYNLELVGKLNRLGTEHFSVTQNESYNSDNIIFEMSRLNIFDLPFELNEFFIDFMKLPKSFQIELEFVKLLAQKNVELRKLTFMNILVEEFYYKWVNSKNKEGKLYFAKSLLEKVKADDSKIMNLIILGLIFSNEKFLLDYDLAASYFGKAISLLKDYNSDEEAVKRLTYQTNLMTGFVNIKNNNIDDAGQWFTNALGNFPKGSNANLYLAYTMILNNNTNNAFNLLNNVINADLNKIYYAIENNSISLLDYFRMNTITSKIFSFKPFSRLYTEFNGLTTGVLDTGKYSYSRAVRKIEELTSRKSVKYLTQEQNKDIYFISKLIRNHRNSSDFWINHSIIEIENKINEIISTIIKNIQTEYENKLFNHAALYDEKIEREQNRIRKLEGQIKELEQAGKDEVAASKKQFEKRIKSIISQTEAKIQLMENSRNSTSVRAFSNSMMVNLLISIFVFLAGGFAEYTANYSITNSSTGSIISLLFLHGLKWGILSFIVGSIISGASSILSVITLFSKKQLLQRKVKELNSFMNTGFTKFEAEINEKIKYQVNNFSILIRNHKKNIANLEVEKGKTFNTLETKLDLTLETEIRPFRALTKL